MSNLCTELRRARRWHTILAFIQSNGIEVAIFIGIISSALATLGWPDEASKPALSAVPGVVLLLERQMRYKRRSAWHQDYKVELVGLERALRDLDATDDDVSRRLNELDLEMRKRYPRESDSEPGTQLKP